MDKASRWIRSAKYDSNNKGVPSVNSFVDKNDFNTTWDDIKDFEGNIWVDTKIPFGGVAGCGTFGWLALRKCNKKEIEKVVGQLSHLTYILPSLKCYLWNLYQFDKSWFNHSATRDQSRLGR